MSFSEYIARKKVCVNPEKTGKTLANQGEKWYSLLQ
jgi:hypothetical protein